MTLLDILKDLTYGELADLAIGNLIPDEYANQPDPHQYEQIVSYINLGLKEIYKRFFLRSVEINVQEYDQIAVYKLDSAFAVSNVSSPEPIKYIIDTAEEPFQDDILKIEEIYDEEGNKIALNDITDEDSFYTPTYRTVQVPNPSSSKTFSVQYRACHPKIPVTLNTNPATVEVELPNSLQEALLYFVGSRAHRATNVEKSMAYANMFEQSCANVDRLGLEVQGEPGDWRFDDHGWV